MPSWATMEHSLFKRSVEHSNRGGTNESGIPGFSGTSTAGTGAIGVPPAGHMTRLEGTGRWLVNLPSGNNCFQPGAVLCNRHELWEFFAQKPGINADRDVPAGNTYNTAQMQLGIDANPNFEIVGTNSTSALATFAGGGGIVLTTAGASADQEMLQPHTNTAASSWASTTWKTDDVVVYETVITTPATITLMKIFAGLKLTCTPLTATDNDQAYLLYDTGNTNGVSATNWQVCTSRTNVDTFVDSGITVEASKTYHICVAIDINRIPYFFINDVLVGIGNGTRATGVTTSAGALVTAVSLKPMQGVHALTAAARAMTLRGIHCSKNYND